MLEEKTKGFKLECKNDNYTLWIDGKLIIENKDLDYVLSFIEEKENNEKETELW